jgi:hypothetical protein
VSAEYDNIGYHCFMAKAISSNLLVRDNAPFLIATLLNDGPEGAQRRRDSAQRELARPRLSAAKRDDLIQDAALAPICNLTEDDRDELRILVDLWLEADGFWLAFRDALIRRHLPVTPYTSFRVTRFVNGAEAIHSMPGASDAQGLMLQLIQHPEAWRLCRCITCGRFVIRKTRRSKMYCGRKCNGRTNVTEKNRQNRESVRERKLIHLRDAAQKWQQSQTDEPCETFMLREAQRAWVRDLKKAGWRTKLSGADDSIKQNSLTKWVNEGLIQIPTRKDGRA